MKKPTQSPNDCFILPKLPSVTSLVNCSLSKVYLDALNNFNLIYRGVYKNIWPGAAGRTCKSENHIWGTNSNVIAPADRSSTFK